MSAVWNHVIPTGEPRAHELSAKCWCEPNFQIYDGQDTYLHNYYAETDQ